MVTVLCIALLAIMMVLVMVESSSTIRLHREVKLLEQQQIKRLNHSQTNVVATAIKPWIQKTFNAKTPGCEDAKGLSSSGEISGGNRLVTARKAAR